MVFDWFRISTLALVRLRSIQRSMDTTAVRKAARMIPRTSQILSLLGSGPQAVLTCHVICWHFCVFGFTEAYDSSAWANHPPHGKPPIAHDCSRRSYESCVASHSRSWVDSRNPTPPAPPFSATAWLDSAGPRGRLVCVACCGLGRPVLGLDCGKVVQRC